MTGLVLSPADRAHRRFLTAALNDAASHFRVTLRGKRVWGWRDRSVGCRASSPGSDMWLRVASELCDWAHGGWQSGARDAAAIRGVAKPAILGVHEWDTEIACLRAELMSYIPGRPCSTMPELRHGLHLPARWWTDLRSSLEALSAHSTAQTHIDQESVTHRFLAFYGADADPGIRSWATAHGDLHWGNLMRPQFAILDWEGWGSAPAGYDAATLYCHSLLVPAIATKVHDTLADMLDTPDGARSQLAVIARMLRRISDGDYPDLAVPLHHHARHLLRHQA